MNDHIDARQAPFVGWLDRWKLTADGGVITTHCSDLLPVRCADGTPAMLKVSHQADARLGGVLMNWWNGDGAAHVLAYDGDGGGLLLERAMGTRSLTQMVQNGEDDQACRVICAVADKLHAPRPQPMPALIPLRQWFRELEPMAVRRGGILLESLAVSRYLFSEPRELTVLHGDLHHDNVLDFGPQRGWLAIDPMRLYGERGFDYANLLCNPEVETAQAPARVARRVQVVAAAARLDQRRLLQWLLAYSGLSAAWFLGDESEDMAAAPLMIAEEAVRQLALMPE